jgi:hypothetical protein
VIPSQHLAWDHYSGIRALIPRNPWKDQRIQRYSGALMGRRTKQSSEIEAEMEGSGDDHESLGLARIPAEFDKFQQSVNRTESTLV